MLKKLTTRRNRSTRRNLNLETLQTRQLMAADLAFSEAAFETMEESNLDSQEVVDSWFIATQVDIDECEGESNDVIEPVTPEDDNSGAARRHREAQDHEAEEERLRRERDALEEDDPNRAELSQQLREQIREAIEDYMTAARAFAARGRDAEAARDNLNRGNAARRLADELKLARENGEDIEDGDIREALMSAYRGYRKAADLHRELGNEERAQELDDLADATADEAKQYEHEGEARWQMGE